jgi:hypothetical protein
MTHRPLGEQLALGGHFGPGVPGAHDDERGPRQPLGRVFGQLGQLELAQHVIAQVHGLGDRLEADRVVGDAGYGKQSGHRAAGQHQPVPDQRPRPILDIDHRARPRGKIDRCDVPEQDLGARQLGPQRHRGSAGLQDRRRDLGQQRHVEHVVRGVDHDELGRLRREPALQRPQAMESGEPRSHDEDSRRSCRGAVRHTIDGHHSSSVRPSGDGASPGSRGGSTWADRAAVRLCWEL